MSVGSFVVENYINFDFTNRNISEHDFDAELCFIRKYHSHLLKNTNNKRKGNWLGSDIQLRILLLLVSNFRDTKCILEKKLKQKGIFSGKNPPTNNIELEIVKKSKYATHCQKIE